MARTVSQFALLNVLGSVVFVPPGGVWPGEEPISRAELRDIAAGRAVSGVIGAVGYPNPDDPFDPDDPIGPYARDLVIALTAAQLASTISDKALGRELQATAVRVIGAQVEQMQRAIG